MFLWNGHHGVKYPNDLLKMIFKGTKFDSVEKSEFILDETGEFQVEEEAKSGSFP